MALKCTTYFDGTTDSWSFHTLGRAAAFPLETYIALNKLAYRS
jgi:hypothetical protein